MAQIQSLRPPSPRAWPLPPHMSSSPRQLRVCAQCGKSFGKQAKLERHLLEVHGATLSIPPATTPPSPSFLLVETQLESALAEANRCFQLGNPSCRLCVTKKPFKNSRDLAQHLVSKHQQQLMCAETVPLPCAPTSSEVSAKISNVAHKRVRAEHSLPAEDKPQLKKAKLSSSATPSALLALRSAPAEYQKPPSSCIDPNASMKPPVHHPIAAHKRVHIEDSLPADEHHQPNSTKHSSLGNAASNTAVPTQDEKRVAFDRPRSTANKVTTVEHAHSVQRSKSAPLVNHSAALSSNSSSRSGTPSSGSKPPITPKRSKAVLAPKDSIKRASSPGAATGANASSFENRTMPIFNPVRGIIHKHTTMMDFSSVGFGSNTRKSYYTLKNS